MMVVLAFHVGASTYFNTSKCSHASLHSGKAGSCKQPLRSGKFGAFKFYSQICDKQLVTSSLERYNLTPRMITYTYKTHWVVLFSHGSVCAGDDQMPC